MLKTALKITLHPITAVICMQLAAVTFLWTANNLNTTMTQIRQQSQINQQMIGSMMRFDNQWRMMQMEIYQGLKLEHDSLPEWLNPNFDPTKQEIVKN